MGNAMTLGFVVFFLVFTSYLTTQYDRNICRNNIDPYTNTTLLNSSDIGGHAGSIWDYVWNSRCEGVPSWYKFVIYTPLVIIGLRSVLATS